MKILETLFLILHVIVALLLMTVVLLQQGKGGGLGPQTGGTAQVFGGSGAGNILTKMTWIFATIFMLTSVTLAGLPRWSDKRFQAKIEEKIQARQKRTVEGIERPKDENKNAPSSSPSPPSPPPSSSTSPSSPSSETSAKPTP